MGLLIEIYCDLRCSSKIIQGQARNQGESNDSSSGIIYTIHLLFAV